MRYQSRLLSSGLVLLVVTALALAKPPQCPRPPQAPALIANCETTCLCSSNCVCGCNQGQGCDCTVSAARKVRPAQAPMLIDDVAIEPIGQITGVVLSTPACVGSSCVLPAPITIQSVYQPAYQPIQQPAYQPIYRSPPTTTAPTRYIPTRSWRPVSSRSTTAAATSC